MLDVMNRRGFLKTLWVAPAALSLTPVAMRDPGVGSIIAAGNGTTLWIGETSPDGEWLVYKKIADIQEFRAFCTTI